jgi:hypothetical protein
LGGKNGVVIADHGAIQYLRVPSFSNLDSSINNDNNGGNSNSVNNEGDGDKLQYLILASDGVWDVMAIEEVMAVINTSLNVFRGSSIKTIHDPFKADKVIRASRTSSSVSPESALL